MYVYEFQRKAREYLLGQKLSLKSITQKYNKDKLEQQRSFKQMSSILNSKTESSVIITDSLITEIRQQKKEKAFLIRKSPDNYKNYLEKKKYNSIYARQITPVRQMSIAEYVYPEPIRHVRNKQVTQTSAFKNFVAQKHIKTEDSAHQQLITARSRKPFQRYVSESSKQPQPKKNLNNQNQEMEQLRKLSGWSINSNESKF
ncbi:unnamed protein product (macronuclear) [Paramecium tetraurelia]|uniref:TPX2 C-terminal domain-containing protein n=1 Tax=Paramecium tetraurelia TaxID=5888 RepID=A0CJ31_PARTE|nr:uncharacterized protein GSPATT00007933001 [Paramecium tetraurelia]CAK70798.1 unnamed protein product [Paramecium tetraurelia]|eukprot:XP_001438195.1 hypothetical protein (macronuclear) [Paramecium tetraurelia strain d4-2]